MRKVQLILMCLVLFTAAASAADKVIKLPKAEI